MTAAARPAETLYINGKFTAQVVTGVQRVAAQLLRAVDERLAVKGDGRRWVLLCPRPVRHSAFQCIEVRITGPQWLPLHLWEQFVLPWAARRGRLLNLAGSSPAAGAGQLCMVHDAAVFDTPHAYRPAFVRWYRWLFRRQARQACWLTVSAFSRERLAHHLGLDAAAMRMVPNGGDHLIDTPTDDAVIDRLGLRGRPFLLAVGSPNPNKNHHRLLQAMDHLQDLADLHLVVVGGGPGAVFASRASGALPARVILAGAMGDAPLKALYEQACGLVFPSLYEGFGLPPLEAMSCGCAVAAARAAAIPEVCGDAALYFDPHSVPDMAQAMRRLATDGALRLRLADAGRARVRALPWRASARALLAVVEEVM